MAVEKEGNKSSCKVKVKRFNYLPQELFNMDAFVVAESPEKWILSVVRR